MIFPACKLQIATMSLVNTIFHSPYKVKSRRFSSPPLHSSMCHHLSLIFFCDWMADFRLSAFLSGCLAFLWEYDKHVSLLPIFFFVLSGLLQMEPNCLFCTSQIQIFFYVLNSMRTCHQLAASLLYLDLNIF